MSNSTSTCSVCGEDIIPTTFFCKNECAFGEMAKELARRIDEQVLKETIKEMSKND